MRKEPLLSVIVPVYGTEKLVSRCLDSILESTYRNIEVIVVGNEAFCRDNAIMPFYMDRYPNIKLVKYNQNNNIYGACKIGAEKANGEYITFVRSDLYPSVDFYRRLIEQADFTNSDMVIGEIRMSEEDRFVYYNLQHTRLIEMDFSGKEGANLFFKQSGKDFSLKILWNKLFRRELWNTVSSYVGNRLLEFNVLGDIILSSLLWSQARHITNIHRDFICIPVQELMGGNNTSSKQELLTYEYLATAIAEIDSVFDLVFEFLSTLGSNEIYNNQIKEWKNFVVRSFAAQVENSALSIFEKRKLMAGLKKISPSVKQKIGDTFFTDVATYQKSIGNEELKKLIASPEIKYVSFDIFDTLVFRPFWEPTDLFFFLGDYVDEVLDVKDYSDFYLIRIEAEQRARELKSKEFPGHEDVTLNDIYRKIQEYLNLSDETRDAIRDKEIELEIAYCKPRKFAQELFKMALDLGKKIIIVSDMYLPQNAIEKILDNTNYRGYLKLYVSSEEKVTKASGNLFKYITRDLGINTNEIIHLGDNLHSDVAMAQKAQWNAMHFPKATDRFINAIPHLYGGESISRIYMEPFAMREGYQYYKYLGVRTMLGFVANELFANPFEEFHPDTDFNADPRVVGYYALGMHMFAITQWIAQNTDKYKYDNFNFIARDGYLAMECYKEILPYYTHEPKINYLRLNRSAILLLQIQDENDFYSLPHNINIFARTPENMYVMFEEILKKDALANRENLFEKYGFIKDNEFRNIEQFLNFINVFKAEAIDSDKIRTYTAAIKRYLGNSFEGKSATFDVGYSSRIEGALAKTFGYNISPYYIHTNTDVAEKRAIKNNLHLHTFFEYTPGVTGVVREMLISHLEPSCKFLKLTGDTVEPVYRDYNPEYNEIYVVGIIQDKALQFVRDIVSMFKFDIHKLIYQRADVSLPHELFISLPKMTDRMIFSYGVFEDDMGMGEEVSVIGFWNGQIENVARGAAGGYQDMSLRWISSKWKRAICLYFLNRDYLKFKIRYFLQDHPKKLAIIEKSYRAFRRVFRALKR